MWESESASLRCSWTATRFSRPTSSSEPSPNWGILLLQSIQAIRSAQASDRSLAGTSTPLTSSPLPLHPPLTRPTAQTDLGGVDAIGARSPVGCRSPRPADPRLDRRSRSRSRSRRRSSLAPRSDDHHHHFGTVCARTRAAASSCSSKRRRSSSPSAPTRRYCQSSHQLELGLGGRRQPRPAGQATSPE